MGLSEETTSRNSIISKVSEWGDVFSAQGNVYLVISASTLILNPSWVKRICQREGTDGIVVLKDVQISNERGRTYSKAEYLIYNTDGSYSLISGNGLASASAYIRRRHGFEGDLLMFYNDYTEVTVIPEGDAFFVGFRRTDFINELPLELPLGPSGTRELTGYYMEMPNEHLVIILEGWDGELKELSLEEVVEALKGRTGLDANVSLVKPLIEERTELERGVREALATGRYEVRVWERGVGETGSCGSAAAAITNLLVHLGANLPEYRFIMPGGEIRTLYSEPTIYIRSRPELLREVKIR